MPLAIAPQTIAEVAKAIGATGGRGKKKPRANNTGYRGSTNADYLTRRIARDRPDVFGGSHRRKRLDVIKCFLSSPIATAGRRRITFGTVVKPIDQSMAFVATAGRRRITSGELHLQMETFLLRRGRNAWKSGRGCLAIALPWCKFALGLSQRLGERAAGGTGTSVPRWN